ncbi:hypothetical protein F2Q70_00002212 [Brassica cretica]|uniref:Uncharacterized protein n=1 Tax=Brassica cretica TaxID=69181 RepID=A0A8S9ISL1_BRACR|nr:hypothetical protein F2Q70_00002212 [Brassica cretica]
MHGLMSYRRFGKARSLHSDRAEWTLGRYVATELRLGLGHNVATERNGHSDRAWLELGRYVATGRRACAMDGKNNLICDLREEIPSPKFTDCLKSSSTPWLSPIRHGSMMMMPSTPLA